MPVCCVSGCGNKHVPLGALKFYKIPRGCRTFQANRRLLWQQAIQKANGSVEDLARNASICGAHFISGEVSLDIDDPDFVPSVFTSTKQSSGYKKKRKWIYGQRKKRCRTANAEAEGPSTPPRADYPDDFQMPSSPNKAPPSLRLTAALPDLSKMIPTVLLKSVFKPASGFQCELCNQTFTIASQLLKHNQLHEEQRPFICELCGVLFTNLTDFTEHQREHQPSFPCNMCDRSFTTSQNLKRHKLLHVKDGRKCQKCGVLFCQRHNHILYVPQTKSEQDSYMVEESCEDLDGNQMPENSQYVKPEPNQTADLDDGAQSTITITYLPMTTVQIPSSASQTPEPLPKTHNALPPASHTRILTEIPEPVFKKPYSPSPPAPRCSRNNYPATFVQPHLSQLPEFTSSLKMFSPQFLTSAFLEVKRDYEYIFRKPRAIKIEDIVKEEPCELPLIPQSQETVVKHIKEERAAYDLEIVL
ncbi:uncharacterized protein [Pagrus major]|uniref:uncharacterized protein n=1 Tax=Pagrus major TaxID=143350 RepID=UPI003CC8B348